MNLEELSNIELLSLMAEITSHLQRRGVIRTNNILGDYAEYLVCKSLDLQLLSNSTKGIDAVDKVGKTYQIKARTDTERGIPTIKSLRSFDFDYLIIVIFKKDLSVKYCGKLSSNLVRELVTPNPRVNGFRLTISSNILKNKDIEVINLITQ